MKSERIRKFKWFWAWQDDREEEWLHQMALQGWHLVKSVFPTVYEFERGEPRDVYYRLDYKDSTRKDNESYRLIFTDAGWEHCGAMSGWQYFRKESEDGSIPEIFTDNASKIKKYQRIQLLLLIITIPLISGISTASGPIKLIYAVLLLIYGYSYIKLIQKIKSLKED